MEGKFQKAAGTRTRGQVADIGATLLTWLPYHAYAKLRPIRGALHYGTHKYGHEIDRFVLIAGGAPIPHKSQLNMGTNGESNIELALQEFSGWFAPLAANGCELTVIQVGEDPSDLGGVGEKDDGSYYFEWGKDPAAKNFMMDLAAQNNGKFVKK